MGHPGKLFTISTSKEKRAQLMAKRSEKEGRRRKAGWWRHLSSFSQVGEVGKKRKLPVVLPCGERREREWDRKH